MIYYFIGQPDSGKSTLGEKLHKFLKTEKRNWRRDVFHIEGKQVREINNNKDYSDIGLKKNIKSAHSIVEYLHLNGCDVVISTLSPYLELRENLKDRYKNDIIEIYLHTTESREHDNYHVPNFDHPISNFIDIDTTRDSPVTSFSKIITNLTKLGKI